MMKHGASLATHGHGVDPLDVGRVGVVAAVAALIWLRAEPGARATAIGAATVLIAGWPIVREALRDVIDGRMTRTFSAVVVIAVALVIGQPLVALVLTLLVLAAKSWTDSRSAGSDAPPSCE